MPNKLIALAALGLVATVAGCGGGSSNKDPADESGTPNRYYHRIVNVVPDAPPLQLWADDVAITGAVDYARASKINSRALGAPSADLSFAISGLGPDGESARDLVTTDLTAQGNTEYSFVVTGQYDALTLIPVVNPRRDRPLNGLYFQFVHAATGVGAVDVYVTDPDTDLSATAPVASLGPAESSQSMETPFRNRRIRLTEAGTLNVVFDSGILGFQDDPNNDSDGIEWLVTIADNLVPATSPVQLVVSDGVNSARQILEKNEAAALRTVHASEVFPVVDVIANGRFDAPLATGLSYRERSGPEAVPEGRVSINVTPTGQPGTFLYEDTFTTGPGLEYTVYLTGPDGQMDSFISAEDTRSVSTDARMRFINLAPDSDYYSVYVGETANDPPVQGDRRALDLAYEGFTAYQRLVPGTYQVTMTERYYTTDQEAASAEETITIGPFEFNAPAGSVTTMVILPPDVEGGPETLQIYDDTAP